LRDAWDPKKSVGWFSAKTQPLSDACKEALVGLGAKAALVVTFVVEPVPHGDTFVEQHFVRANRPSVKKTP